MLIKKGCASQTRRNFVKAMRSSINEQAEMAAERRRIQPTIFDPLNSGRVHKTLNRGCEVEVKKFDLHGNGIHKR